MRPRIHGEIAADRFFPVGLGPIPLSRSPPSWDTPTSLRAKARGALDADHVVCRVETGKALIEAGLHPATGGTGAFACSGNMLLDALVACAGVTLKAVATAIGFDLKGGVVSAEGDLDFRGTLGVTKDAPVGFREIRLAFDLQTGEPQERIDQLIKLTERYCVVYQTLAKPGRLGVTVNTSA